ncbi:MAG: biosis protein MshQ, partial [Solirubrobacteraceae bacterium]|nr:biosis protein MshQ [Solirubrobacteraceae bacterium]
MGKDGRQVTQRMTAGVIVGTTVLVGVVLAIVLAATPPGRPASAVTGVAGVAGITLRSASSGHNRATAKLRLRSPAGVSAGDVLVAAVDVRQARAAKPPKGWRLVRSNVHRRSPRLRQSLYVRVAGGSEPARYVWRFAGKHGASGGILAYRGVSVTAPVLGSSGRSRGSRKRISAPTLKLSDTNARLIAVFGSAPARRVSAPKRMTRRAGSSVGAPHGQQVVTQMFDQVVSRSGRTGIRKAAGRHRAIGIGQLIALRSAAGNDTVVGGGGTGGTGGGGTGGAIDPTQVFFPAALPATLNHTSLGTYAN